MFSCGICVLAAGSGLIIAKSMGINESAIAVWISGFSTAAAFYISDRIKMKVPAMRFLLSALFCAATYYYLLLAGQMNHSVMTGLIVGLETYFAAHLADLLIRSRRGGKPMFPLQKVFLPVIFLTLAALITTIKAF